ncbi:MAG: putative metal-binding motif-containing protein [Myxococcota bacterium]|nr:putative metal-binding motif-containing protein [Myxococcota bacterium]
MFSILTFLTLGACSQGFENKLNNVDDIGLAPEDIDDDNDGFTENEGDCDDTNRNVNPDAEEVCDGIDNNCDDVIDIGASDEQTFYADMDGDGFGSNDSLQACEAQDGYVSNNLDCEDDDEDINPDADEVCDGIDNDCNEDIDEEDEGILSTELSTFYRDFDGDNYGNQNEPIELCEVEDGYVSNDQDCDDGNDAINPDADEVCDGIDNNCNNLLDEDDPELLGGQIQSWYDDADNDGFGDPDSVLNQCSPPAGYVDNGDDCDDGNANAFPGAAENESLTECMNDSDFDGYGENTGAGCCYSLEMTDSWGDGWNGAMIELNVNGTISQTFENQNLDGASGSNGYEETQTESFCIGGGETFELVWSAGQYDSEASYALYDSAGTELISGSSPIAGALYSDTCAASSGQVASGTDCDDTDGTVFPGSVDEASATECMMDSDGDGFGDIFPLSGYDAGTDCDDSDDTVFPGTVDEASSSECMLDVDEDGYGDLYPPAGYDAGTDCDDDDDYTFPGAAEMELTTGCMTDMDEDGYGDDSPALGVDAGTDCDDSLFAVNTSVTEVYYNGIDQDCDGGNDYDQDGDGYESDAHSGTDCDDTDADVNPMAPEDFTDGIDNNCSNGIDEEFAVYDIAENITLEYDLSLGIYDIQPLGITVDSYGDAFLVYQNGSGDIFYRKRSADGTWGDNTEISTVSGYNGEALQVKVDSLDRMQLIYTSFLTNTDMYFNYMETYTETWSSDQWAGEVFSGNTFEAGFRIGFDVDGNDLPSFVYYDQDNSNGSEPVPNMVRSSYVASTSLDALSFSSYLLDDFYWTGCNTCYSGTFASLAIDSNDRAHSVFYNHSNVNGAAELLGFDDAYENQYSYVNSGGSSAECVDGNFWADFNDTHVDNSLNTVEDHGKHNSVAIHPINDTPCVAYTDGDGDLKYACKDNSGCDRGWAVQTVDSSSGTKSYASLDFNSSGEAYIAYHDQGDLKLAHLNNGTWDVATVDNFQNVGNYVDMDIDDNDMVHIIYYGETFDTIRYAYTE